MNETDNIRIVKDGYKRFTEGDLPGLLSLFANNIEWTTPTLEHAPSFGGKRKGVEEVKELFAWLDENEDFSNFEPREFIANDDKVVVLGTSTSTVKKTGRSYTADWVHIFTLKDAKVTNFLEFFDTATVDRAFQRAETA